MLSSIAFFFFAGITGVSALMMVFTKNVIRAAFLLAFCLIGMAGLYVIYNAEFLAVVQILIYAGGVVVLLAFGIMLTNRPKEGKLISENRNIILGTLLGATLFALLTRFISSTSFFQFKKTETDQVEFIGKAFLTDHLISFEIIAYLLLVVLVGAAFIAQKQVKS